MKNKYYTTYISDCIYNLLTITNNKPNYRYYDMAYNRQKLIDEQVKKFIEENKPKEVLLHEREEHLQGLGIRFKD